MGLGRRYEQGDNEPIHTVVLKLHAATILAASIWTLVICLRSMVGLGPGAVQERSVGVSG